MNKTTGKFILIIITILTTIILSQYGKSVLSAKAQNNVKNLEISNYNVTTQKEKSEESISHIEKENIEKPKEETKKEEEKPKQKEPKKIKEFVTQDGVDLVEAYVLKIVDGSTIIVKIGDSEQRVKLIGTKAPEFTIARDSIGRKSASYTTDELIYKYVYLQKDTQDKDEEDNLLRYVWTRKIDNINEQTVKDSLFNYKVTRQGYAQCTNEKKNTLLVSYIELAEEKAKKDKKGIWK